jgi:hypothetical protein
MTGGGSIGFFMKISKRLRALILPSVLAIDYFQAPAGFTVRINLMQHILKVGAKESEMDGGAFFFRIDSGAKIVEYSPTFAFGHGIQKRNNPPGQLQVLSDIDGFIVNPVHQAFQLFIGIRVPTYGFIGA